MEPKNYWCHREQKGGAEADQQKTQFPFIHGAILIRLGRVAAIRRFRFPGAHSTLSCWTSHETHYLQHPVILDAVKDLHLPFGSPERLYFRIGDKPPNNRMYLLAKMIPMQRSVRFVAITFAVTAPYMAFAVYCALHFPQSQWPGWVVNKLVIWFAANILIMTFVARKIFQKPKTDAEIQATALAKTKFARFRWLWFAMALLAVLGTPGAFAVHLAQTDRSLVLITILGLTMRAGWIYFFLWLWWKYRPRSES